MLFNEKKILSKVLYFFLSTVRRLNENYYKYIFILLIMYSKTYINIYRYLNPFGKLAIMKKKINKLCRKR